MIHIDPAAQAAHRRALQRRGEPVTVERLSGTAPNVVYFHANVVAFISDDRDDVQQPSRAGYGGSALGSLTQTNRDIIMMAADLVAARFPLPLQKNDKIILCNGDKLNIVRVDAHKRIRAGAIEATAAAVN
jgi:hypothetical protein